MDFSGEVIAILSVGLTIIGLFVGSFVSAAADRRRISAFQQEWKEESKDFHGRLCTLEERFLHYLGIKGTK